MTRSASSACSPATKRRMNRRAAGQRAIASPIPRRVESLRSSVRPRLVACLQRLGHHALPQAPVADDERVEAEGVEGRRHDRDARDDQRSEEHTSELQSRLHLVCRLLLEKKKKNRM